MKELISVSIPYIEKLDSGQSGGFYREVKAIVSGKENGFAFKGDWLKSGKQSLPEGTVIIEKRNSLDESVAPIWRAGSIEKSGLEWFHKFQNTNKKQKFSTFINKVSELLGENPENDSNEQRARMHEQLQNCLKMASRYDFKSLKVILEAVLKAELL